MLSLGYLQTHQTHFPRRPAMFGAMLSIVAVSQSDKINMQASENQIATHNSVKADLHNCLQLPDLFILRHVAVAEKQRGNKSWCFLNCVAPIYNAGEGDHAHAIAHLQCCLHRFGCNPPAFECWKYTILRQLCVGNQTTTNIMNPA